MLHFQFHRYSVSEEVTETIPLPPVGGRGIGTVFLESNVEIHIERLIFWPIPGIYPIGRIICLHGNIYHQGQKWK